MNLQMKIKHKIRLLVLLGAGLTLLLAIGYMGIHVRQDYYTNAQNLINSKAEQIASRIEGQLNRSMAVTKTLAVSFSNCAPLPQNQTIELTNNILRDILREHEHLHEIWSSWELSFLDSTWTKPYGRIVNEHYLQAGMLKSHQTRKSQDGDKKPYQFIKTQNQEVILPFNADRFDKGRSEKRHVTSIMTPIRQSSGKFAGFVGADLLQNDFQKMVKEQSIRNMKESHAFLLTPRGRFAAHPDTSLLNKKIQINPFIDKDFDIHETLSQGKRFSIQHKTYGQQNQYMRCVPFYIGDTQKPWYLGISIPVSAMMKEADQAFTAFIIISMTGLALLAIVAFYLTHGMSKYLEQITGSLKKLAKGKTDDQMKLSLHTGDEIQEMSQALNTTIDGMNKKNAFANHIKTGELEANYALLSDEDQLGQSLLEMRNNLKNAREEQEKQRKEEQKRQWTNEGLNQFADILRQYNHDLQALCDQLIKNLVYYLEANQGGIFLTNNEDELNVRLELTSAFAYNRKKKKEKGIDMGEGLIGTCAIEKESIYLEEIPQDYIDITSGLGDANPDSLLLVPMKLEEEVQGVIEIASFKKFKKHQIEFVEKVAESIASTISSVRVNMKTQELLDYSNQQSQELSAQEEEMRQNMEELQATQEENARQKMEMENLIHAFHQANYVVEYDTKEKIININDNFLNLLGMKREEVIGTHHSRNLHLSDEKQKNYKAFWDDLRAGKVKKDINRIQVNGDTYTLAETYTPIKDNEGNIKKILKIAINTSEFDLQDSRSVN